MWKAMSTPTIAKMAPWSTVYWATSPGVTVTAPGSRRPCMAAAPSSAGVRKGWPRAASKMRNHTATMAAAMSPAMMPSRRYRDRESMRDLLSSTPSSGRHAADPRGLGVPPARDEGKRTPVSAFAKSLPRLRGQTHDHLADVVAGEEAEKGLGRVLDALHNGFVPLDAPGLEPAAHLGEELRIEAQVV